MVVVIYQLRAMSREAAAELCRLSFQVSAPEYRGRIRGRCLVSEHDPLQILGYEEWSSREARDVWLNSEVRQTRYRQVARLSTATSRSPCMKSRDADRTGACPL